MINLVYFGTSHHSVTLLETLKNSPEVTTKLVITKSDKPVGRNQVVTPSPVKTWCIKNGIDFMASSNLKKELPELLQKIKGAQAQIGVVAYFGAMIPKEVIDVFKFGIVNVHPSLLPKYRGACPAIYTILNGDQKTGVTFLLTNSEMDKGDILKQIPYDIQDEAQIKSSEDLYTKLFEVASYNIVEVLEAYISGALKPWHQNESKATYTTPSGKFDRTTYILKTDAKIDWSRPVMDVNRAIKAYNPWPVTHTTLGELALALGYKLKGSNPNLSIKIYNAHIGFEENTEKQMQDYNSEKSNESNKKAVLVLDKVQIEGKKIMKFEDLRNGYFNYL